MTIEEIETLKERAADLEAKLVRIHSVYFNIAEFSRIDDWKYLDEAIQNSMSDQLKEYLRLAIKRSKTWQQNK